MLAAPFSAMESLWKLQQVLIEAQRGKIHAAPCLGEEQRTRRLMTGLPNWDSLKILCASDKALFYRNEIESISMNNGKL